MSKATTLTKKQMFDALQVLKENVQPSDLAEASSYVIFQNERVCAMNDSVAVSVPLFCEVDGCAVELQLLYDFIRKMPDKEFMIGLNNGNLKIKGKNSIAEFATRDDILFDENFLNTDTTKFKTLPETFAEALNFTGFATDPEEAAYNRCVIYDGCMYALSAYRGAKYDMGDDAKEMFDGMVFITPECSNFVNKMHPTKYLIQEGYVHLYDNDMRIYSARTRSDSDFPVDMANDIISVPEAPKFALPSNFSDVLDRCNPFSGKTAKVKKVSIAIDNGELNIVATREDNSRLKEKLMGVQCSAPVRFTVNLKLLSDMVKYCEFYYTDGERLVGTAMNYQSMAMLSSED